MEPNEMKEKEITAETFSQSAEEAQNIDQGNEPDDRTENRKKGVFREVRSWVFTILIAAGIAFLINSFILVNATVPTGSMEPTIQVGDRLFGFRLSYLFGEPQRGDIVIFKYPINEKKNYIKRVIGLPGETVRIENGKIYINDSDTPLEESYLKEEWIVQNDGYVFEVPEDSYLMLGDNRNNSADSRYWPAYALKEGLAATENAAESYAYVKKGKILGKALFTYYHKFRWLN